MKPLTITLAFRQHVVGALRRRPGRLALSAVTAVLVPAALVSTAPAHAATRPAPPRSCAVSAVVHLHGRVFHVRISGRFGIVPMRGHKLALNQPARRSCRTGRTNAPQLSGALTYGGGAVATNPVVYLDFWGSQWDSDSNGVEQYMQGLFGGLGDSSDTWSTTMTQYTDGNGNPVAFTGSVLAGTWRCAVRDTVADKMRAVPPSGCSATRRRGAVASWSKLTAGSPAPRRVRMRSGENQAAPVRPHICMHRVRADDGPRH